MAQKNELRRLRETPIGARWLKAPMLFRCCGQWLHREDHRDCPKADPHAAQEGAHDA